MSRLGYFYIISNPHYLDDDMYKIGKTLSNEKDLKKRYLTYFIDPIVIYHREVIGDYSFHETNLKRILEPYRIKNNNDNLSEFIRMKLVNLIREVNKYFDYVSKYPESIPKMGEYTDKICEDKDSDSEDNISETHNIIIHVKEIITERDETYKVNKNELSKKCTSCGIEKNICDFDKKKSGKFGYNSICKLCRKQYDSYRRGFK